MGGPRSSLTHIPRVEIQSLLDIMVMAHRVTEKFLWFIPQKAAVSWVLLAAGALEESGAGKAVHVLKESILCKYQALGKCVYYRNTRMRYDAGVCRDSTLEPGRETT